MAHFSAPQKSHFAAIKKKPLSSLLVFNENALLNYLGTVFDGPRYVYDGGCGAICFAARRSAGRKMGEKETIRVSRSSS